MSLADAAPPAGGRRPSAALGALVLSGSNVLRMVVQLAMLPILARLVGPAEYGLVALAVPFVLFCNMFADAGLSQALARRMDATPALETTTLWISGALGLGLALLAAAAAWPLGLILDQPRLPGLIAALSPILLMSGLTAVANARVIRTARFGVFAGGDFVSTLLAAGVALYAALNGAGAWSLVAQQLTLWSVKAAWVNAAVRPPLAAGFRPAEVKALLAFGLHAIGANLSDFLARNLDNIIIGAAMGATALGYYAMAYQIVRVPDLVLSGPLYLYVFTAVAKAAHDGAREQAGELALSALRLTSTLLAPVFAGLAVTAPLAVELVLGQTWRPTGPVLAHLAPAGFGFAMCLVSGAVLMALGRSSLQFRLAVMTAAIAIGLVAGAAPFGVDVVATALGAGVPVAALICVLVMARGLKLSLARTFAAFAPAAASSAALVAAVTLLQAQLAGLSALPRLLALIVVGGAVYVALAGAMARKALLADARAFSNAHAR